MFSQALAGEPELVESLPKPLAAGSFGFAATLAGDVEGRFAVVLDGAILESPLVGEGVDQKAGWGELLREVADAAAGELLAKTGKKCRVEKFEEIAGESKVSRAFQLKSGERGLDDSGARRGARSEAGGEPAQAEAGATAPLPASARLRPRSARESNCCWMSSWRLRCALAAGRCRWARFSTWVRETWCSWTAMSPIRWT